MHPGRSRKGCATAIAALLFFGSSGKADARLDDGGWMSREIPVAVFDDVSGTGLKIETVYATTRRDGNPGNPNDPDDDALTLWAFCSDPANCNRAACEPEEYDNQEPPEPTDPFCLSPCKWRREIKFGTPPSVVTGSGQHSYAPPAVTSDGKYIFVVSDEGDDGRLYLFNNCGTQLELADPPTKSNLDTSDKGFYARPVVHEWEESGVKKYIFFAVNYGNNGKAWLHAIDPVTEDYWSMDYPVLIDGLSSVRYEPVVDTHCANCSAQFPRLYVASNNPGDELRGWAVNSEEENVECIDDNEEPPCMVWENDDVPNAAYRLGGVLVPDVLIATNTYAPLVVSQLEDGVVGNRVDGSVLGNQLWGSVTDQTHRSMPELSVNERDPSHILAAPNNGFDGREKKVVYVTSRDGEERLYRFDPGDGFSTGPAAKTKLFPPNGASGIATSSYSWAVPSPATGLIYTGGATDYGIHRINVRAIGVPPDEMPSTVEWFDYVPPDGWRTAPSFSSDGERIHIGSANGRFFILDADRRNGLMLSCFDTWTGVGGNCPMDSSGPVCCTDGGSVELRHKDPDLLVCWDDEGDDFPCIDHMTTYNLDEEGTGIVDFSDLDGFNTTTGKLPVFVQYFVDGVESDLDASMAEVLNETSGDYESITYLPSPFNFWFGTIPLTKGKPNTLRFAMLDRYGNEVPRHPLEDDEEVSQRITIINVPSTW